MSLSSEEQSPKECPRPGNCKLFDIFESPAAARVFRMYYCENDQTACARYQKAVRGEHVPDLLLPNGVVLLG